MADKISRERRSANMRAIRGKNTVPELTVRRLAHRLGYRFRLHRNDLPGRPDLAFPSRRKVIFVHGCFWHQHRGCQDGHTPNSNAHYWKPKLAANCARDKARRSALRSEGWKVLVIWECQLQDEAKLAARLQRFLE